ncbi:MAG: single-strand binding protein [Ignavibacteria bacterium]|nr:single-strand binding protein [Ignavibacteria bacterium]
MAKSLNRVQLIGNLGKDPELRTTAGGQNVCSVSIATSDVYKDKNGNQQETTEWHSVVFWDKLAEIAHQYLRKGKKVYLEGRIKYRQYEKDGQTRYATDIVVQNMIMLDGSRSDSSADSHTGYSNDSGSSMGETVSEHIAPEIDDVPF